MVLLVLDSSTEQHFAEHAEVIDAFRETPNLIALHLDESAQRDYSKNEEPLT